MGNLVEMHSDTRRGNMDIEDIRKETMIHWNKPPLAQADKLGKGSMNRNLGEEGGISPPWQTKQTRL